tara:strand:- start:981 stop:1631 length:651 start_codon:yes stop_codon:yes gene_type:complete
MATSASTLTAILETLARKYDFAHDDALSFLAKQELLPKKLIPKGGVDASKFASKKAEELAATLGFSDPKGAGSGKNGKWTLADVEKHFAKPVKSRVLCSPNALNLANERGLSLAGKTGTGKDGRILLKDVEGWLDDDDDDEINISPRALQEAKSSGIGNDELGSILGSGLEGRILLDDVRRHISDSEGSTSSGGGKKKKKKLPPPESDSDAGSDSD